MMSLLFPARLRHRREDKRLTQSELAKMIGINNVSMSHYESGTRRPNYEVLVSLSKALETSVDYLLGIDSHPNKRTETTEPDLVTNKKICSVPVLGRIPAGIPIEAIENVEDYEDVIIPKNHSDKDYFCLKVVGKSMSPRIDDGDIAVLKKQSEVCSGDIAAVSIGRDEVTLKKVKMNENGIMLIPNNPAYEPMFYSAEDIEKLPVTIIGKVVEVRIKP